MIDIARELRRAVDTGSVSFGFQQAKKKILNGTCQLVIISSNAEKGKKAAVQHLCKTGEIPFFSAAETGPQLGAACGKPFVVSFACIEKAGKSKILDAAKQGKTKQ